MELNLFILHDFLPVRTISCLRKDRIHRTLKRPAFLSEGQESLRSDRVYILHPSDLKQLRRPAINMHFIFTAPPKITDGGIFNAEQNDYLYAEDSIPIPVLYDAVADVFEQFHEWELSLSRALADPADPLQALGDCSLDFIRNPFSLCTASFFCMYCFEKKKPDNRYYFRESDCNAFHENADIQDLLNDNEFLQSWNTDGPCLYPTEQNHYYDKDDFLCFYQNISVGGKKILRVVVGVADFPMRDSDYPILDMFSQYVQEAVNHLRLENLTFHPPYLDQTLCSMAHGETGETERIDGILRSCSWKAKDSFLCCVISAPRDSKIGSLLNACWRLEEQIAGACAIPDGEQILLLVNMRLFGRDRNELITVVAYQLREFLMKAGYSYEFHGLENIGRHYTQAVIALTYGQKKDSTLWSYRFENYALSYMIEDCCSGMEPEIFCHNGLLRLLEYDRRKDRNYAGTLRVYLENNMSVTQTTKQIYMQRASFQYQLKKILEITGANLQDYHTRLHLLLSFQLLDRCKSGEFSADKTD